MLLIDPVNEWQFYEKTTGLEFHIPLIEVCKDWIFYFTGQNYL